MFGFDNKTQDLSANSTAQAPDPVGVPPMPQNPVMMNSTAAPSTPDPMMQAATDPGADEGTMNDDTMPTPPMVPDTPQMPMPSSTFGESVTPPSTPAAAPSGSQNDLLSLKQEALQQLSPLVGHLDQSPEEKFKTTMMMIQASDDESLIPVAYEAANAIVDEKVKAQALLDIVNEINYFTQHQK